MYTAVVDGGRIAELGSHSSLVAAGGIYAKLVHRQLTIRQNQLDVDAQASSSSSSSSQSSNSTTLKKQNSKTKSKGGGKDDDAARKPSDNIDDLFDDDDDTDTSTVDTQSTSTENAVKPVSETKRNKPA